MQTDIVFRGFNFRNFKDGKPFAPLPTLFEQNMAFLDKFSDVSFDLEEYKKRDLHNKKKIGLS